MSLIENFIEKQIRWGRVEMFYLWGHSYEFDNDNNWDVIEEFAKYAGNRSDIWYATNIEIYNYVKAYESLEVSYDQRIIYNPTAIDVWVEQDEKVHLIKVGQTIYL